MADEVAKHYTDAVLSYAPVSHWCEIIQHAAKPSAPVLHKLLAVDCNVNLIDPKLARKQLLEIEFDVDSEDPVVRLIGKALTIWIVKGDRVAAFEAFFSALKLDQVNMFLLKRCQLMALLGGFNSRILEPALFVKDVNLEKKTEYFHGMLCFGYEQAERFKEAEEAALEGFGLGMKDGWLDHGYAHSLYFQGKERLPESIEFLKNKSKNWSLDTMMPFLFTHLWWHYSLVLLESGQLDKALDVFDQVLWPELDKNSLKPDLQVQINALELLWKFESLHLSTTNELKQAIKKRWQKVLEVCKPNVGKFDDLLHSCLVLRGAVAIQDKNIIQTLIQRVGRLGNKDYEGLLKGVLEVCGGKNEVEVENGRKKLRDLQSVWPVVGNSTEQRAVFLELAYGGPVVCGQVVDSLK